MIDTDGAGPRSSRRRLAFAGALHLVLGFGWGGLAADRAVPLLAGSVALTATAASAVSIVGALLLWRARR
ncbi:hypothetical protein ACNS7O_01885 [Haloferacaceae archaeon DSL9]